MTKACSKCGDEKILDEFYPKKTGKGGRSATCKECDSKSGKAYRQANPDLCRANRNRWKEANPEKAKAIQVKYRESHPEVYRAISARYYKAHPEKANAWVRANPDRRRETMAAWRRANAERLRAQCRKREAIRGGYEGAHHTVADVAFLFEQQAGLCAYCDVALGKVYHVDHVVPLSRGGGNGADNICLACPACNLSKGSRLFGYEWCGCNRQQRSVETHGQQAEG